MRLGVDIDGVLYDWEGYARETLQYGEVWGLPEKLTDEQYKALYPQISHWDRIEEVVGKKNWDWFWANQNMLKSYLGPNDYRDNVLAMEDLSQRHEVYLITNRPRDCRWQTYHWLSTYGDDHPSQLAGVIHCKDKTAVARGLGITVVVDDRPSELEKYLAMPECLTVYGVRRPWNDRLRDDPRIRWVDDLTEMAKEEDQWPS